MGVCRGFYEKISISPKICIFLGWNHHHQIDLETSNQSSGGVLECVPLIKGCKRGCATCLLFKIKITKKLKPKWGHVAYNQKALFVVTKPRWVRTHENEALEKYTRCVLFLLRHGVWFRSTPFLANKIKKKNTQTIHGMT